MDKRSRSTTHDANGNQTNWTNLKNSQTRTLVWDDENCLMSPADMGESTRFKYDESGVFGELKQEPRDLGPKGMKKFDRQ